MTSSTMHRMCARIITLIAAIVAASATIACGVVVIAPPVASGRSATAAKPTQLQQARARAAQKVERRLARTRLPQATAAPYLLPRCDGAHGDVVGQGRSCRTSDGLYALADAPGLVTHGPDLVAAAPRPRSARRAGTIDDVVCSAESRTRHVLLAYLIPRDHAGGSPDVRGDRYSVVADQLRQATYDASAIIDARAGELAPGSRRRIRVACDADARPTVLRVVLPRTAAEYRDPSVGFNGIIDDLDRLGLLPSYDPFTARTLPAVRRILAYYDAQFVPGIAGQGTMYRRSTLLGQGAALSSPMIGRSVRNINNSPPQASVAVEYGTTYGLNDAAAPDPDSLLHELSHTMGAVQDEPPTSSLGGHCIDGQDVMCYDDGGARGSSYTESACPLAPGSAGSLSYDCNGDTYFHPAPPAGNPLAMPTTWHLGLAANQTLASFPSGGAMPGTPRMAKLAGRGTSLVLRWKPPVGGARVAGYDVVARAVNTGAGDPQPIVRGAVAAPVLRPATTYDLEVRALDMHGRVGAPFVVRRRTGPDTTPPARVAGLAFVGRRAGRIRLAWDSSTDNVAVTRYLVERRVGARWQVAARVGVRSGATGVVSSGWFAIPRTGVHQVRVRALDRRGNASPPSMVRRVSA